MKTNPNIFKSWATALLCLLTFGICATNALAQETKCPYADDSVILYSSPSTLAKAGCAMNDAYGFQDELAELNKLFDRADAEIAKAYEKDDFPKKQYDYLSDVLRKASEQDSIVRAFLVSYFKYVDCVVVAAELPETVDEFKKKGYEGLSLSLVFNANPSDLDPRKYLEAEDIEILKEDDSTLIGKLRLRDNGEVKATIYFGGTILKDVDKYVIVVGSESNVEKKIDRYQKSSAFVSDKLGVEGLVSEYIVKEDVFAKALSAIPTDEDDARVKIVRELLGNIKGVDARVTASKDGFKEETVVAIANETAAQNYVEIATGAIAGVKLAAANKDSLKPEEQLGLDLVKKVSFKRDGSNFVANAEISTEQIKAIFKLAKEKCPK